MAQARDPVPGFKEGYRKFEQEVVLRGLSKGLLENYGRNVAHLELHFGRCPEYVSVEEINCYLYHKAADEKVCESYITPGFKAERCPCCGKGEMHVILSFGANAPFSHLYLYSITFSFSLLFAVHLVG